MRRATSITLDTVPDSDGVSQSWTADATTPGTKPGWFAFALRNTTDKQVERWLVIDRYNPAASGVLLPDLDARRIQRIAYSRGYAPERIKSDRADVFRITLEPGRTVTFVAELASDRIASVQLWNPIEYEQRGRDRYLFSGVMIGITGLLALFLTAVFAANHKAIFPVRRRVRLVRAGLPGASISASGTSCSASGPRRTPNTARPPRPPWRRASSYSSTSSCACAPRTGTCASWSASGSRCSACWWPSAFLDPRLAATFVRLSSVLIGGGGRGHHAVPGAARAGPRAGAGAHLDAAAGLAVRGRRYAARTARRRFRHLEPDRRPRSDRGADRLHRHPVRVPLDRAGVRRLAAGRAAAARPGGRRRRRRGVGMERPPRRDQGEPDRRADLGLKAGELSAKTDSFVAHMHPADRERFKLLLWSMKERGGGELRLEFRMRHVDASYRWFELDAASLPSQDRRNLRCVGLVRDATDAKRAQERLLHNAVYDSLSGLPNRELFLDRLVTAAKRAALEPLIRPSLLFIDIDRFKAASAALDLPAADSLLLTIARRLARNLGPQDTLARVGARSVRAAPAQPDRPARARHAGRAGAPLGAVADRHRRAGDRADRLGRHRHLQRPRREPGRAARRRPRSPCTAPSARAPTASRSTTPRCAPTPTGGWRWRASCAPRSTRSSSRSSITRSSTSRPRRWPASRRSCAGSIRGSALSTPPTS